MKYTLSVLVTNESGILTRITSLFSRRGYNIESLAVGPAELANISRITMVLPGTKRSVDQLIKQLYKIVGIVKVEDVTNVACVERELMLVKINTTTPVRREIIEIANILFIENKSKSIAKNIPNIKKAFTINLDIKINSN